MISHNPNSLPEFILGTSVRITTILDVDTVTSMKITIQDASLIKVVDNVDMSNDANKIYSYVWQSTTSNIYGYYLITINAVYSGKNTCHQEYFVMVRPSPF